LSYVHKLNLKGCLRTEGRRRYSEGNRGIGREGEGKKQKGDGGERGGAMFIS